MHTRTYTCTNRCTHSCMCTCSYNTTHAKKLVMNFKKLHGAVCLVLTFEVWVIINYNAYLVILCVCFFSLCSCSADWISVDLLIWLSYFNDFCEYYNYLYFWSGVHKFSSMVETGHGVFQFYGLGLLIKLLFCEGKIMSVEQVVILLYLIFQLGRWNSV